MRLFVNPFAPRGPRPATAGPAGNSAEAEAERHALRERVKQAVRKVLEPGDEAVISVSELACGETGCPDVETVIGIHEAGVPARRLRLHMPLAEVGLADIAAAADDTCCTAPQEPTA